MTIRSSLLAIGMINACYRPGRENGSAKCAMRLRRPDGFGEAEGRENFLCDMGNKHLLGPNNGNSQPEHDRHTLQPQQRPEFEGRDLRKLQKANDGEILESAVRPAWQGCFRP